MSIKINKEVLELLEERSKAYYKLANPSTPNPVVSFELLNISEWRNFFVQACTYRVESSDLFEKYIEGNYDFSKEGMIEEVESFLGCSNNIDNYVEDLYKFYKDIIEYGTEEEIERISKVNSYFEKESNYSLADRYKANQTIVWDIQ